MKIGIDFDGTLEFPKMQEIVKKLKYNGHDLYLITYRYDDENLIIQNMHNLYNNNYLYELCNKVGIERKNIIFTNYKMKHSFITKYNIELHYDDDFLMVKDIINNSNNCDVVLFSNEQMITFLSNGTYMQYEKYNDIKHLY